jgi:hypothetical protein
VASLLPWGAFLATAAAGEEWAGDATANWLDDVGDAAVFCLAVVALPASVALAVVDRRVRLAVLVVLTAVAVGAGYVVVTSDDDHAGMAVLLIPAVAVGLVLLSGVGRIVVAVARRARGGAPGAAGPAPGGGLLEQVPAPPDDRLWSAEHMYLPSHEVPRRSDRPDAVPEVLPPVWSLATGPNGNGVVPPSPPLQPVHAPPPDRAAGTPAPPVPQPRRPFSVPPARPPS